MLLLESLFEFSLDLLVVENFFYDFLRGDVSYSLSEEAPLVVDVLLLLLLLLRLLAEDVAMLPPKAEDSLFLGWPILELNLLGLLLLLLTLSIFDRKSPPFLFADGD